MRAAAGVRQIDLTFQASQAANGPFRAPASTAGERASQPASAREACRGIPWESSSAWDAGVGLPGRPNNPPVCSHGPGWANASPFGYQIRPESSRLSRLTAVAAAAESMAQEA
jgi:hypothetical protein